LSPCNEDHYGVAENAVWVLDGATSLSKRSLPGPDGETLSDAAYFVRIFSDALRNALGGKSVGVDTAIAGATRQTSKDPNIGQFLNSGYDVPSASFALASMEDSAITLAYLGDCTLIVEIDDKPIAILGDSPVRDLDQALLSEYVSLRSSCLSHADAWNAVVPHIRRNRARMNMPGGYPILEPKGDGLDHLKIISAPFEKSVRGLIVTDGLYRLVDTYFLLSSRELFDKAHGEGGCEQLIADLRRAERHDPDAQRWPRLKLSDDATIVRFSASGPTD
jgi:hypothetical protein